MKLFHGIVEDINDPLKADRVRVRVFGLHTDDKALIPTNALPWAQTRSHAYDAGVSGIGDSGSGFVCGTWVDLYFLDGDEQYPIITGSLKGIPVDPGKTTPAIEERIFSSATTADPSSVVVDSSGNPVTTDDGAPVFSGEPQPTDKITGARRASDFRSIGERGIILIKNSEGFRASAYRDSVGIWTIGYGTTWYPNGTPVMPGDTITRERAQEIFASDVNSKFLPQVWRLVTVPVTQQMVDALTSLIYNLGSLKKSSKLITDLNSGNYELAASRFLEYNKHRVNGVLVESAGLTARREREKNLFLAGGIPNAVGALDAFPLAEDPTPATFPVEPLPSISNESGVNIVIGKRGFADPNGKYPLYRDEPDTNRLARHEKIVETIVYRKEASRDMGNIIAGSDGKKTWNQSPIPYNALYPYNRVTSSKSGHLLEFDDTENSKRVHLYHAAGTFLEIDDNGTQVNRIVGDGYQIIDRNGFIHIKGAAVINIDGNHAIKIGGGSNIDVDGKCVVNVFNDVELNVSGDMKTSVAGDMKTYVKGEYTVKVDGKFAVDAEEIHLNSGIAQSLPEPKAKVTPDEIEFSELNVITRGTESAMHYETPEEGSAANFDAVRILKGEATRDELATEGEAKDSEPVTSSSTAPLTSDCGEIATMDTFPPSYSLSRHFRIGSFNKEGSRPIIQQMGLKSQEIACNLKTLAFALDVVKDKFPHLIITSGFRRPGDAANSSATSKHYTGEAVDIQLPGFTRKEYRDAVKTIANLITFDQLILEYQGSTTWIHIGVSKTSVRKQIFTMSNHKRLGNMGELVLLA